MNDEALEMLRYFSNPDHPQSFVALAGRGPVLMSAPHAVLQTRGGRLKAAERYTGMLCLLLHRHWEAPCIYKARHLCDDANHDAQSPYRDAVCELVGAGRARCVVDLHQLKPERPMALCIGTGFGRHLRGFEGACDIGREAFLRRGLGPVTVDDPFAAAGSHTVSATAARAGAAAMQLEINSALLMEDDPAERFEDVLNALGEALEGLRALFAQSRQ